MDLTPAVGTAAILFAVGILLLLLVEFIRHAWHVIPEWLKLTFAIAMAAVSIVWLSARI